MKGKLWQHKANDSKKCGLVVKESEVRKITTESTRQAMYVERNIVAPSGNHCRSGKAISRGQLKCHGTRAETRFRLSEKQTSPFKSAGTSVQSTTRSRGVPISGSNAGCTNFRGSVKGTGYPLHSPVSPSLPLPCVTLCYHITTGLY